MQALIFLHTLYVLVARGPTTKGFTLLHRDKGALDEDEARRLFQQLIVAMDYCHQMGVVNRCSLVLTRKTSGVESVPADRFLLVNLQRASKAAHAKMISGGNHLEQLEMGDIDESRLIASNNVNANVTILTEASTQGYQA